MNGLDLYLEVVKGHVDHRVIFDVEYFGKIEIEAWFHQ